MNALYVTDLMTLILKQGKHPHLHLSLSKKLPSPGFGVVLFALMIMKRACLYVIYVEFFVHLWLITIAKQVFVSVLLFNDLVLS